MNTDLILGDWSLRLTITLLHFLWQGLAIGLLAMAAGWYWRRSAAGARYRVYVSALLMMAACVPLTWLSVSAGQPEPARPTAAGAARAPVGQAANSAAVFAERLSGHEYAAPGDREYGGQEPRVPNRPGLSASSAASRWRLSQVAPYTAIAYLCGVLLMLVRLLRALWRARRLRSIAVPVDDGELLAMIGRQSRRLTLHVAPAVAWCGAVSVPVVVGVFKPLILLPASLVSGLAPDQLEPLLVHELAHIRRYDLLFNLFQRLIEAVLFFHPAVWFISRRASVERENACDDLVVWSGWPQGHYAGALVQMAQLACRQGITGGGSAGAAPLLSASGERPSQLKRRVLRLLGQEPPLGSQFVPGSIALVLLATAALLLAPVLLPSWAQTGPAVGMREAGEAKAADGEAEEAARGEKQGDESALAGVVVLADGERPAAGVEILVSRRSGEIVERLRTDEEGRFPVLPQWREYRSPGSDHEVVLLARDGQGRMGWCDLQHRMLAETLREGRGGAAFPAALIRSALNTLPPLRIVLLDLDHTITGRVVGPDGQPLEGVRVLAATLFHPANGWSVIPAALAAPSLYLSTGTDVEGDFELRVPASAVREILVVQRDWMTVRVPVRERHDLGTISMAPAGSIEGRITEAATGRVLPNVPVLARTAASGLIRGRGHAISDAEGRFVIGGLPAAPYNVYTGQRHGGDRLVSPVGVPVQVAVGTVSEAKIGLIPGRPVRGRVIADSGDAVADFPVVWSVSHATEKSTGILWFTHSDDEGRFHLHVPPGVSHFGAMSGWSELHVSGQRIEVDAGDEPLEVTLEIGTVVPGIRGARVVERFSEGVTRWLPVQPTRSRIPGSPVEAGMKASELEHRQRWGLDQLDQLRQLRP